MDAKMKYVYTVYQERSFVKAAEKLFISQPSLSITVKRIEQSLGITIFDRSIKPLGLTEAGYAYIEYIESLQTLEERLTERIQDLEGLNSGCIKIGGSNYILSSLLPPILKALRWKYPGIKVDLIEDNSPALRQKIVDGTLDLVIDSFDTTDSLLDYYHLIDEELLLATPPDFTADAAFRPYRISQQTIKNNVDSALFLPEPLVLRILSDPIISFKPGTDISNRIVNQLELYGAHPEIVLELDQITTCINYIEEGLGSSFVPDTPFRYRNQIYRAHLFHIKGNGLVRKQNIIRKKNKYFSNTSKLFIDTAVACFSRRQSEPLLESMPPENEP